MGGGAPEGFLPAVLAGLAQLSRMGSGELSIADSQMRLAGQVLAASAAPEVEAELKRAVEPAFALETAIEVAPPAPPVDTAACSRLVADLLGRGTVRFASGRADIDRASRGLLDRMAAALLRCPSAAVRIVGHTDGVGDGEQNQRLSQARANAVLAYLTASGIGSDRLSAAGQGAGQPLAPNDTEAGRALNRRIEIEVKERAP